MAELVLDGKTAYDISPFETDRYADIPEMQKRANIENQWLVMIMER